MKQLALHLLRKSRLLPIAEAVRFWTARLRSNAALPATAYDAFGELNMENYLFAGRGMADYLAPLLDKSPGRVLEWGCGPARVVRHLPSLLPRHEYFGCDCNRKSIDWCRANVPGVSFAINDPLPPAPFPAEHFDAIYSISVFTHLSREAHFAWAKELHRLLRPGGLLICSLHGDIAAKKLLSFELERYRAGDLVIRGDVSEGTRCFLAYHPESFVHTLLRDFTIERHEAAPNGLSSIQDIWITRKH